MSGGLNIPETMGLSGLALGQQQQEEIHQRWSTSYQVMSEVTSWGFPQLAAPPCRCPPLTAEILNSSDTKQYTEVYSQLLAWHHYADNILAWINAELLELANEMKRVELEIKDEAIRLHKASQQKKPPKSSLDDLYKKHPRWVELNLREQVSKQRKFFMGSHVERLERDLALISRQVEIRKEDILGQRINNNMPGRGMYPNT
jgi:hypothetical protein